ncbi:MAG: DNA alkylation repair protein [Acidobacteria bacterium]|nr:DNA alkylation repair protein [Acidobacteriota bacterium]
MKLEEVMQELEGFGNAGTKKVLMKHGATEPFFGVKIADLKKTLKKIKGDQQLALKLFDTGNSDAMYLAGLVADGSKMTESELNSWAKKAYWYMISEYTVPWVASEHPNGWKLGLKWTNSSAENIASSGWSTLSALVSVKPDAELDIKAIGKLMTLVEKTIHSSQNRVRYTMNGFLISCAAFIAELSDEAIETAKRIGKVDVEMGGTACKVPFAPDYIEKIKARRQIGQKKKTVKC